MKPGAMVDKIYGLREQRHELERKAKELKVQEDELRDQLIATLSKDELSGLKGKLASATRTEKLVGQVTDKLALWKWAKKHDAVDLFHARVSNDAARARWEAGEKIDGVDRVHVIDLLIRKLSNG